MAESGVKNSQREEKKRYEGILNVGKFSVSNKSNHFSSYLVSSQRSFNLCLIITDHIKGVACDFPDAMKNQDTFIASIEDDIVTL